MEAIPASVDKQIRVIASNIYRQLPSTSIDVDDLLQEGRLGYLDAVERFDPSRGVTLATFVRQRIRGAILDYLRHVDWLTRDQRAQAKASGHQPTLEQLSAHELYADRIPETAPQYAPDANLDAKLQVQRGLAALNPRYRFVVEQVMAERPMLEIARELGVNQSRTSQIYKAALEKMRAALEAHPATLPDAAPAKTLRAAA